MSHRFRLLAVAVLLASAPAAHAADPGRWRLAEETQVPLEYFQGLTHGSSGNVLFVGLFEGAYRTDTRLAEQARVASVYPADVAALGFNHVGDPTFDAAEGGRLLAPMECYRPTETPSNTCGIGGFGVVDPVTLAWRYWVRLDQADIAKAMWAEVSPDGQLVWTSSGADLLAYRATDISAANAASTATSTPIRPVQRLVNAVPPSGVTGAVFYGGRLLLAGEADGLLQVWSVDVTGATPARLELERLGLKAEAEGLDVLDMRGGLLHWLLSPLVAEPTYGSGHSELISFLPAANARLRVTATRTGKNLVATVSTIYGGVRHPVLGATVKVGKRQAVTTASGRARWRGVRRGRLKVRATKLELLPGTKTVAATRP
jgi:hypothetical protein